MHILRSHCSRCVDLHVVHCSLLSHRGNRDLHLHWKLLAESGLSNLESERHKTRTRRLGQRRSSRLLSVTTDGGQDRKSGNCHCSCWKHGLEMSEDSRFYRKNRTSLNSCTVLEATPAGRDDESSYCGEHMTADPGQMAIRVSELCSHFDVYSFA